MPSIYAPYNPGLDRDGRAADGHRFVAIFLALVALLSLIGCASLGGWTLGGKTADEAIGPARTPEARQCRLEILIAGAALVMTDRVVKDGDRFEAGTALAQLDELETALANTRKASAVFRETELARARGALILAVGKSLKARLVEYLTGGAISEDRVVGSILAASTGAAVIADAAHALTEMEASRLDLPACQSAVDGQLAQQRERLETAARPR